MEKVTGFYVDKVNSQPIRFKAGSFLIDYINEAVYIQYVKETLNEEKSMVIGGESKPLVLRNEEISSSFFTKKPNQAQDPLKTEFTDFMNVITSGSKSVIDEITDMLLIKIIELEEF